MIFLAVILITKYGYQNFPNEYNVADCINLYWILEDHPKKDHRKLKQQLKKLIFWMPEKVSS